VYLEARAERSVIVPSQCRPEGALVHESWREWVNDPDLGRPFGPIGHILNVNSRIHPKYKTRYRVSNWAEYDRALVQRGDITLWFSPDAADS
jgi:hypothetical protein